jgi:hypothetical protein
VNLKNTYYNITWFLSIVNTINPQSKNVKLVSWHLKVKCGSDHNGFSKGKEHMPFHGLVDHVKDYFIQKMSSHYYKSEV